MAWFIDADKLLADIETLKKSAWYEFGKKPEQSIAHNWYLSREEAVDKVRKLCIKAENVVDAEPVRRGRWVIREDDYWGDRDTYYQCSACGDEWTLIDATPQENLMKYCPSCGARMVADDEV